MDEAYQRSLACALELLRLIDSDPGIEKHVLLSKIVFAILAVTREQPPSSARPTS